MSKVLTWKWNWTYLFEFCYDWKIRYTLSNMISENAGYFELEHTADWELKVWAPDIPILFIQAAFGMYKICGIELKKESRITQAMKLEAQDLETLLVSFLSELLFIGELEGIAFDNFKIDIDNFQLTAEMYGAPIAFQLKEIKAVTYHNLKVNSGLSGFEVKIVFDV